MIKKVTNVQARKRLLATVNQVCKAYKNFVCDIDFNYESEWNNPDAKQKLTGQTITIKFYN